VAGDGVRSSMDLLAQALQIGLGPNAVEVSQPLARYTALRVGGPADLLVKAESVEMLRRAVTAAWQHGVPCRVLGGGSNVLISDAGWRGLVVLNRAKAVRFPRLRGEGESGGRVSVHTASGASISTLARQCVSRGLAGLEWAAGIPGTVGGAVVGNAGAWGGDIASTMTSATILGPGGAATSWPVERFQYGYRTSILKEQVRGEAATMQAPVVLDARLAVRGEPRDLLETKLAGMMVRRKASQPPGATCGSVFKNPPGDYAGRLIDAAGLKGTRHGGAEISPVHANFIVNLGNATAADVKALVDLAQSRVSSEFGVSLELEIELLGEW
jgi:UDP-N-acetylmuramate dehydrogenase